MQKEIKLLNLEDLIGSKGDSNDLIMMFNEVMLPIKYRHYPFNEVYGCIKKNQDGIIYNYSSMAAFKLSGIECIKKSNGDYMLFQSDKSYTIDSIEDQEHKAALNFNTLNKLPERTGLCCNLYLRSKDPVVIDKPAIFSVGGYSFKPTPGLKQNYQFDFAEMSANCKKDKDNHLIFEVTQRYYDHDIYEESNNNIYINLDLLSVAEFDEIFYECYENENETNFIPLEIIEVSFSEFIGEKFQTITIDMPLKNYCQNQKKRFLKQLDLAIAQYGQDHIDIITDNAHSKFYGIYHSKNNSFGVTDDYVLDLFSKKEIIEICNNKAIGYQLD